MVPQVLPMLAVSARPFDSEAYSFEIKWDGIRALAAVDGTGWRLWGRGLADYTQRYPELAILRQLPSGTIVDGELVAWVKGRAILATLMRRHPLNNPWKIGQAQRWCPVHYVVFDLLYYRGRCLLKETLDSRRARLAEVCQGLGEDRVIFSAGVSGAGQAFYEQVVGMGHEGVVAKHRHSTYQPGKRSKSWRKIKPRPGKLATH